MDASSRHSADRRLPCARASSPARHSEPARNVLLRFVAAAHERRSLGIASHGPCESWGGFLPEVTTAVSMLDRLLHHCHIVITARLLPNETVPSEGRNPTRTAELSEG